MNASVSIPIKGAAGRSSAHGYNTGAFWERLWRSSGLQAVFLLVAAYVVSGHQPGVGVPADVLATFHEAHGTRILVSAVLSGLAVLNLMWFAAALRATLSEAGRDGWGAAATAASAAFAASMLLITTLSATVAFSAGSAGHAFASELNDFGWAGLVLSSFPRAMLIMAGTFGFWRAGIISNRLFGWGVAAVVLVLAGGTTWATDGFWAPDGGYSTFVSPAIGLAWVVAASRILLKQPYGARAAW